MIQADNAIDVAPCTFCGDDAYNGAEAHACCIYWDQLEPGRKCPACIESRKARRDQAARAAYRHKRK